MYEVLNEGVLRGALALEFDASMTTRTNTRDSDCFGFSTNSSVLLFNKSYTYVQGDS